MAILEITSDRFSGSGKGRFYVDSNADKLVDSWYSENRIYGLTFKSKVWTSIKRKANALINSELRKIDGVNGVYYSRRAGCRCGCSPGYIITGTGWERKSAFVTINFTPEELQPLKEFLQTKAVSLLQQEKLQNEVAS